MVFILTTYRIIDWKINNSNTYKILKNRFKKIKNSSIEATLNYHFFKILHGENIIENRIETNNIAKGFVVMCF